MLTYLMSQSCNCAIEIEACVLELLSQLHVFRSLLCFIRVRHVQRTDVVRQLQVRGGKFVFQLLEI